MTSPDNLTPSPTSIIDHPISRTRLHRIHHFLIETSQVAITLAETEAFIQVMRDDVLAERLRFEDARSGHRHKDSGPLFEERVDAAFPCNDEICRKINWTRIRIGIQTWRTKEKVKLGETFGEQDLGQILFNHAEYGSTIAVQPAPPWLH